MKKKFKILSIVGLLILIFGYFGYNYIMRGGARDLADEKTEYSVESNKIIAEFTNNIDTANKKYLEKAIEIKGNITAVKDTIVILNNTVVCTFKNADIAAKKDKAITIKGRVVGYDDLIGELKLDNCFIID